MTDKPLSAEEPCRFCGDPLTPTHSYMAGCVDSLRKTVDRLRAELAESRASDEESLRMYRTARARAESLQAQLTEARAESEWQARLVGMGTERILGLEAQLSERERELKAAVSDLLDVQADKNAAVANVEKLSALLAERERELVEVKGWREEFKREYFERHAQLDASQSALLTERERDIERLKKRVAEMQDEDVEQDKAIQRLEREVERIKSDPCCPHFVGASDGYALTVGGFTVGVCRDCKDAVRREIGELSCDEAHGGVDDAK